MQYESDATDLGAGLRQPTQVDGPTLAEAGARLTFAWLRNAKTHGRYNRDLTKTDTVVVCSDVK